MTGRSRTWWIVVSLVAAVVVYNVLLVLVGGLTGGGTHGRRSSSYGTVSSGLAAYAELLDRSGHRVVRLRKPLSRARLDPATTVVVLDPGVVPATAVRLLRLFVEGGGRLIGGGDRSDRWLRDLLAAPPEWSETAGERWATAAPVPEVARVRSVESAGDGAWAETGGAVPALAGRGGAVLAAVTLGRGRAELLADASPLQNRLLDRADNAALGLALVGPADRDVVFVESVHGYGEASGLAAVPARWWWALGGLGLAAVVFVVARGRRLGPPEEEARALPPPRREYVEALAGVLARTRAPQAAEPVRTAVREELGRRVGRGQASDDEALRRAAAAAGLQQDEVHAIFTGVRSEADLLAAGRALARLARGGAAR